MGISTIKGWQSGAVQWDAHRNITLGAGDVDLHPKCVGIYVGVAGDIVAEDQHGVEATYTAAPNGILQGRFSKIIDATTAATNLTELIYTGKRQYMGITHIPRGGWTDSGSKSMADDMVFRHLDTNGDGTGTKEMIGDYSLSPEEFYIQSDGGLFFIHRMVIQYQDSGNVIARQYGCGITLANGIEVEVRDQFDNVLVDLLDGIPITGNEGWAHICYDLTVGSALGNEKLFAARWTFARSGNPVVLRKNEKLVVRLNDSFTGLISQTMMAQGYRE